jgi:cobalt-zinc-cadmium efflux system outer membrane protein
VEIEMKTKTLAFSLAIGAAACTMQAQQTMHDMTMEAPQTARAQLSALQAKKPNRTSNQPDPMAADMQSMGHNTADPKAKAAARSEQNSVAQQAAQAQAKPGPAGDYDSLTVPIQEIQEPEAVGFHTGSDLPAPELLREVFNQPPMSLQTFLGLAEASNPTLAQVQRDIDRSQQQAHQVSLPPNPTIGYSGDHIRGGSYHGGEEGAFFSQEFVLGRKLALRRDIYRAEGRSNEFALEIQRARVRDDVGRAFFDTLTAQESVVIRDRLLKVALDADTNAHELERVGQADAADILNAEIAAEQAKIDFVAAQRSFLASFTQLATHAGQPSLMPHPLIGGLVEPPDIDAEAMVNMDVQESPAVKRSQADVALAEARVKSARRESVPNLNVKAGEWYSGEELGSTNKKAGPMSFVEAGVQIPLWNRNQGNIGAAQTELERSREDVLRIQLQTRNMAEPYAQQYQTARFTAERYRTEMLPRARRAYQLQAMKYQQMALAYPAVIAAQRMLFSLQLSYLHALEEEWRAAIALQNYTLTNGLDQPMRTGTDTSTMNLPTGEGQ